MRESFVNIINHPHYISPYHPRMSKWNRATQFAAFKALDGLDDMIIEEGRETDILRDLTEDDFNELNQKLYALIQLEYMEKQVTIIYFQSDKIKSGGAYKHYTGIFKYYRSDICTLVFKDDFEIEIENIIEVEYKR